MNAKIEFRKVRTYAEVISISAEFVRQNFVGLFKSVTLIALPFMLIALLVNVMLTIAIIPSDFLLQSADRTASLFFLVFVYGLLFVLAIIVFFSVIYSYIVLYIRYPANKKIKVKAVYRKVFHDIWLYFSTAVLMILLFLILYLFSFALGLIHFLVAGMVFCGLIYMMVSLSFVFMVRLVERRGFIEGFYRSLFLIREHWWQTFLIYIVTAFITFSLVSLPSFIFSFFLQFVSFLQLDIYVYTILIQTIFFIFYFFVFATNMIVTAFQYFALVEKKQGVGMRQKVERIGIDSV
ncbi:MAG: hypothetical protein ACPG49_02150 [Chitinophagales bacterium]